MPASFLAGRFRSKTRSEQPEKSIFSFVILLAVLVTAEAGLVPVAARAAAYDPFVMVLMPDRMGKSNQQILRFEVRPDAADYLVSGGEFIPTAAFDKLRKAAEANNQSQLRALALEEGWNWYAWSAGWTGAAGTFAEHALEFTSLSNANNALTNVGGVLTVLQIGVDLAKGDNRQAGADAFKGIAGFAIGKFGSSALQIGGIAYFIFDQTLSTFGTAAWAEREEAWRRVYQVYYATKSGEALNASRQGNTLAERFRAIRARKEGGRSVNDWTVIASFYFQNAKTPEKFQEYLDADIATYVGKFWDSSDFLEYSADGGWSTAGFARASSLTQAIKDKLEAEYADVIRAKLIKDVLPKIQRKAVEETLAAEAKRLNGDWRKSQNQPVTIEVSAYDIKQPTHFEMILPNGGTWGGTISPGEPRKLRVSKIAMTLAGFPDTIALDGPNGRVERKFKIEDSHAEVVFGAASTTTVSVMSREEGALNCVITTTSADGKVSTATETRSAPSATPIHFGFNGDGSMVMGRFDPASGWAIASPGKTSGTDMSFAAPYFENIEAMKGCASIRRDHDFYGVLASEACAVERTASESGPDGETRETRCTSTMTLKLTGMYGPVGGVMTYAPIDPKMLEQIQRGYEGALNLQRSLPGGEGFRIADPNQLLQGHQP